MMSVRSRAGHLVTANSRMISQFPTLRVDGYQQQQMLNQFLFRLRCRYEHNNHDAQLLFDTHRLMFRAHLDPK
jgi:hypothetical protein